MRKLNLIGRRFGKLTVLEEDPGDKLRVICKCDCGNTVSVRRGSLTKSDRPTSSCGCFTRENIGNYIRAKWTPESDNRVFDTNFSVITRKAPRKDNKYGCTGVCMESRSGKYVASIALHHKLHVLGRFDHLEDAIAARKQAEEEMFAPILAEYRAKATIQES